MLQLDYMELINNIIQGIEVDFIEDDFINDECLLSQSQIYLEV